MEELIMYLALAEIRQYKIKLLKGTSCSERTLLEEYIRYLTEFVENLE